MIKEICFKNWKSFKETTLYIDPLTILIGANASGKSNIVDGLDFLNRIANGQDFQKALNGEGKNLSIRGGVEWAARKPYKEFTIEVLLSENDIDYKYSITVQTLPQTKLVEESLLQIMYDDDLPIKEKYLFNTDKSNDDKNFIDIDIFGLNPLKMISIPKKSILSILSGLENLKSDDEFIVGINAVTSTLKNIFILNPVPSHMRSYSPLSEVLNADASNLAGVIATLPDEERNKVEDTLLRYVSKLPERDIRKIWTETVGPIKSDAMLYCKENWTDNDKAMIIDAQSMSDGTLRFIAILVAILTRPENSQLVIEEVDNGLHSSRIHLLLDILKNVGKERNIDILITTHNTTLLNEMGASMIPFVMLAYRTNDEGSSKLTLLEDIEKLPKLLAAGPLGQITTDGSLLRSLNSHDRREIT